MVKIFTPSDSALNIVDYSEANGSYTTGVKVAALLGISDFTTSTSPTKAEIGDIIRRCEDYIDEITNCSWRENIAENEFHDFKLDYSTYNFYDDYRGKIRLHNEDIRKVIRIAIWDGSVYDDIASAVATVTLSDYSNADSITLTCGTKTWTLEQGSQNDQFNREFGKRTTAQEIVYLINCQAPTLTAPFTGANASKNIKHHSQPISDFFYANLEEDETITIVSLLPGSDGSNCTIAVSGSGISKTDFTDKETYDRNGDWWDMKDTGDIFFRSEYPYHTKHSIKVTYSFGSTRVPAVIEDAATKLVACEIIAADDSYVLLGDDNTSGLDLKSKYDSYKADVDKILKMKKRIVYYLDSD